MALLEIRELSKNFGGLIAVNRLSFDVAKQEILGLIGPNGSGKTTVFNLIAGFLKADHGSVRLHQHDLVGLKPHEVALRGVARTFQLVRVFSNMSVIENMRLAVQPRGLLPSLASAFRPDGNRAEEGEACLEGMIESFGLGALRDKPAGGLSYGERKLVELAATLIRRPEAELILLDEPMSGLDHAHIETVSNHVRNWRARGKTFIVIEHDMKVVMNLCERIVVLNFGNKIAEGLPAEIQDNQTVIEAYFGS